MTRSKHLWQLIILAGAAVAALVAAASARAEAIAPSDYTLYLSAPGTGTVAGVAYADEDVLRYSPTANPQWAMHFDGSVAGLPAAADIDAYAYLYNAATFTAWHYMSFDRPVAVPGLGTVDDSDVALYRTSLLGNTWSLFFDGSAYGLTTDGEDIDALEINSSDTMLLSTSAGFNVPTAGNAYFKGGDEDALVWESAANTFTFFLDGASLAVAADNDLFNLAISNNGDALVSYLLFGVQKAANVSGVGAGAFDVLFEQSSFGTEDYGLLLDASASGFPKIDAMDANLIFD